MQTGGRLLSAIVFIMAILAGDTSATGRTVPPPYLVADMGPNNSFSFAGFGDGARLLRFGDSIAILDFEQIPSGGVHFRIRTTEARPGSNTTMLMSIAISGSARTCLKIVGAAAWNQKIIFGIEDCLSNGFRGTWITDGTQTGTRRISIAYSQSFVPTSGGFWFTSQSPNQEFGLSDGSRFWGRFDASADAVVSTGSAGPRPYSHSLSAHPVIVLDYERNVVALPGGGSAYFVWEGSQSRFAIGTAGSAVLVGEKIYYLNTTSVVGVPSTSRSNVAVWRASELPLASPQFPNLPYSEQLADPDLVVRGDTSLTGLQNRYLVTLSNPDQFTYRIESFDITNNVMTTLFSNSSSNGRVDIYGGPRFAMLFISGNPARVIATDGTPNGTSVVIPNIQWWSTRASTSTGSLHFLWALSSQFAGTMWSSNGTPEGTREHGRDDVEWGCHTFGNFTALSDRIVVVRRVNGRREAWAYPICVSDVDNNGLIAVTDILYFLQLWFNGSIQADADNNGRLESIDIITHLNAWFSGC